MPDFIEQLGRLEEDDSLHEARILMLLAAPSSTEDPQVRGLTKLAKLDFLLRYPTLLERALERRKISSKSVDTQPHERTSVESRMVRYRFGPWDHRYRRFINTLVAKGLATVKTEGRTVVLGVTEKGRQVASQLAATDQFKDVAARAAIVRKHFDISATRLMNFVYETFPEIASLQPNQPIGHEPEV